jgi:hypothetical protein
LFDVWRRHGHLQLQGSEWLYSFANLVFIHIGILARERKLQEIIFSSQLSFQSKSSLCNPWQLRSTTQVISRWFRKSWNLSSCCLKA